MVKIDGTPWGREALSAIERDAIAAVLPPDASVYLSSDRKPSVHRRETYSAFVGVGDRSATGKGRTPLAATLVAWHNLEVGA